MRLGAILGLYSMGTKTEKILTYQKNENSDEDKYGLLTPNALARKKNYAIEEIFLVL